MLLQEKVIDYRMLADAVEFYTDKGYSQCEVPWVVESVFSFATSPTRDKGIAFELTDGDFLVASAEQGFVKEDFLGRLTRDKKWFAVSPCFRNEKLDETHSKWFMKLELFASAYSHEDAALFGIDFLRDAKEFFERYVEQTNVVRTHDGFDINGSHGLELGSYGVRTLDPGHFIAYGTGLALPRFTLATEWSGT